MQVRAMFSNRIRRSSSATYLPMIRNTHQIDAHTDVAVVAIVAAQICRRPNQGPGVNADGFNTKDHGHR